MLFWHWQWRSVSLSVLHNFTEFKSDALISVSGKFVFVWCHKNYGCNGLISAANLRKHCTVHLFITWQNKYCLLSCMIFRFELSLFWDVVTLARSRFYIQLLGVWPYRPQTISATAISATARRYRPQQKTISATRKIDIGHNHIGQNHIGHKIYGEFIWRHRVDTSLFRSRPSPYREF